MGSGLLAVWDALAGGASAADSFAERVHPLQVVVRQVKARTVEYFMDSEPNCSFDYSLPENGKIADGS
jgi:hypothetical protein